MLPLMTSPLPSLNVNGAPAVFLSKIVLFANFPTYRMDTVCPAFACGPVPTLTSLAFTPPASSMALAGTLSFCSFFSSFSFFSFFSFFSAFGAISAEPVGTASPFSALSFLFSFFLSALESLSMDRSAASDSRSRFFGLSSLTSSKRL